MGGSYLYVEAAYDMGIPPAGIPFVVVGATYDYPIQERGQVGIRTSMSQHMLEGAVGNWDIQHTGSGLERIKRDQAV
jgi:hypothetical protein